MVSKGGKWTFEGRSKDRHPVEEEEWEDDEGVYHLDLSRKRVHPHHIRDRIAFHYGCQPDERPFHGVPVINQYAEIGSAYFSLHGSPPKGHAIYIKDPGEVHFYNVHGRRYARWNHVTELIR